MPQAAAPLDLPEDRIDLWVVFPDAIQDERLLASYREILTDDERTRELRFHFLEGQRQHLITRALVRTTLSRYTAVRPADWRFTTNEHGRPELDATAGPSAGLAFNVSHTHGLIVCAVARSGAIGVDVEHLDRTRSLVHLAERYFAPFEVLELRSQPADLQDARFFDYWTLKEAYIKAIGMGLSMPLNQFGLELPGAEGLRFRAPALSPEETEAWSFWLLRPGSRHTMAVCASCESPSSLGHGRRLLVRQTIPMQSEQEVSCPVVRTSERPQG